MKTAEPFDQTPYRANRDLVTEPDTGQKRGCQGERIEKTRDWALGDQNVSTIASNSCYLGKASVSEGPFPDLHQPSQPAFLCSEKFPEIDHDFLCFLEVGRGDLDKPRASNGSLDAKSSGRIPAKLRKQERS